MKTAMQNHIADMKKIQEMVKSKNLDKDLEVTILESIEGCIENAESFLETEKEQIKNSYGAGAIDATSEEALQVENNGWISVDKDLPKHLETVFISNGKGWTSIGCLVGFDDGYHWAESNGVIYEENGKIVAECESDDLDVKKWHTFPLPPKH